MELSRSMRRGREGGEWREGKDELRTAKLLLGSSCEATDELLTEMVERMLDWGESFGGR